MAFPSRSAILLFSIGLGLWRPAFGQAPRGVEPAQPFITQRINESDLRTLWGNTRSAANAANDRGRVVDDFAMEHMQLQLSRPAAQEEALAQFIEDLHNPASANFHKWLTPAELGKTFGPAQQDIQAVSGWLGSYGFTVNTIYPSGLFIDFSGTASQVQKAFHTEIHRLDVNGKEHYANMSDPQIPAALAPVVRGIVSLHDFSPRPMNKPRAKYTYNYQGTPYQAVVPADLATIYNLTPLFNAGISGQGQTIAVIEDSDPYRTSDFTTFRSTFGLSQYSSGSLTTLHPGNCRAPGVIAGTDAEVILDAEWASAAAPGATIEVAACRDTTTTFGGFIALQNLLNSGTAPAVVSISYGECEAENGSASNAAISALYQQAVAQGVSVFVAAGDEGGASCDAGASNATHGIGVSAFASTQYNVAVGGTDFGDSYANTTSSYWSNSNTKYYGSALSYIPEIPWNDSCASMLIAEVSGYSTPYGANGFCNTSTAREYYLDIVGGSGGPSGCFSGTPSAPGIVGGSCKGVGKPSWQTGVPGLPNDGVRDIPDVSLFSADGVWGHYYVFCWSNLRAGGASCSGAPSNWAGAGGTSFSSPIMAGIQALVNQKTGSKQGNPNYFYYQLAAQQYGSNGTAVFHDVVEGDIDMNCTGTNSCYDPSVQNAPGRGRIRQINSYGVLSTSDSSYEPAFGTTRGWDFATGIGSVNAYNLVMNWPQVHNAFL